MNPFLTKLKTILTYGGSTIGKDSLISSRAVKNTDFNTVDSPLRMEDDELDRQTIEVMNKSNEIMSSDEKCVNGVQVNAGIAILDDTNAQMIPEKDSNIDEEATDKANSEQPPPVNSIDQLNVDYFNKWMDSLQSKWFNYE